MPIMGIKVFNINFLILFLMDKRGEVCMFVLESILNNILPVLKNVRKDVTLKQNKGDKTGEKLLEQYSQRLLKFQKDQEK